MTSAQATSVAGPRATDDGRTSVMWLSTIGFTLLFAVWLMFGVLGVPIRNEFGLSDLQLSWLMALAVLNGAIWRLAFGVLTDRVGGRKLFTAMMLATAVPTFLISQVNSYGQLLVLAFLVGLAGNAFSVGIAWNSAWFPKDRQGFALGVFGAGNVGASVTKLIGPTLIAMVPAAGLGGLVPGGWRFVPMLYSALLVAGAAMVWFGTPREDRRPGRGRPLPEMLAPLRQMRVWRFSLYYVVVFGAYVALSAWLPKYYVDVFSLELRDAALLTALFIFPASLLRPVGGALSDRFGARRVMYWTFGLMLAATALLSAPEGHIVLYLPAKVEADGLREVMHYRLGVWPFTLLVSLVGVAMGIGKAAVFKHIPEYFPKDVGAVGGLVGMLGALGGFFLPPLFAISQAWLGLPQSTFFILFLITLASALWMHMTVLRMLGKAAPHLKHDIDHRQAPRVAASGD
ncbi:MAG TPA: nitrate/nitrite transporter [Deinococcales bacterium]|nr:nitrate/nitrite transporter [Deinococcales bacterium]